MPGDALEPQQIFPRKRASSVQKKNAARGLVELIEGYPHHGMNAELLLGSQRQARNTSQRSAITPVPAKTRARSVQTVPTNRRVHIVEHESVRARQRKIFWK